MSERRGQEQAPKVQPPERPLQAPAIPPVSSGAMPDNDRQLDLLEAILILTELKENTEAQEWAVPAMKRAVLTGVKMCIQRLNNEVTKR